MPAFGWMWIPIVLAAAFAQTLRNASQRSLIKAAGTLPATFVRFGYGLPFTIVALAAVALLSPAPLPSASASFVLWDAMGAFSQLAATAFLVRAMEARSFVVAVAYSKTELLQIGVLSVLLLGEPLTLAAVAAIVLATAGVVLLSIKSGDERGAGIATWFAPSAWLGLASGACFALSAVGYRGAALALGTELPPWVAGIYALLWAQAMQTVSLGAYLWIRDREGLARVAGEWKISTAAGLMGALASTGWLTAFAMRSAVDVRIVGLIEIFYSYVLSRQLFRELVHARELLGMLLVVACIVVITLR